jgi:hypothetical protein
MNILNFFKSLFTKQTEYTPPTDVPVDQFPENNSGVIEGRRDTDFVAGKAGDSASPIRYEIVLPNYDWRPFVPVGEVQYYPTFDSMGCTGYSDNNTAEVQLKQSTGLEFNFSDEAINFLAGCTQQGNYLYKPADVARKQGRILQKDWTILNPTSWQDLQKAIPAEILAKAIFFIEAYQWVSTDKASMKIHLKQAPVQIIINKGTHAVCCVYVDDSGWWYYDSYAPFLKKTTEQPTSGLQIVVKPMTQFVHKTGTQEYGFYVPAIDPSALLSRGENLGMPISKPDGTIDFTKAKEITVK